MEPINAIPIVSEPILIEQEPRSSVVLAVFKGKMVITKQ